MAHSHTLDKMHRMKMYGMFEAYKNLTESKTKRSDSIDQIISGLIDAEWDDKEERKTSRLIKAAKFRYKASMEDIDFNLPRKLDKETVLRLSDPSWIANRQNVIITGPTGVGKSYLACALGHGACLNSLKVRYFNVTKLFEYLRQARADGTYAYKIDRLRKMELLIIDDFGVSPIGGENKLFLLEILEDRYSNASTILTTQLPVKNWHEIISDPTISDAICDRIIHNSYKIEMKGESVRKIYGKKVD